MSSLEDVIWNNDPWIYLLVAGAAFLATALLIGFLVPSQTVGLLAGTTVSMGATHPAGLVSAMAGGAFAGSACGYVVGQWLGVSRISNSLPPRLASRIEPLPGLLQRNFRTAILIGRWNSLLRGVTPTFSGAVGVPLASFLVWSLVGGVLWSAVVIGLGYLAHRSFVHAQMTLGTVSALVLGLVVTVIIVALRKTRLRAAKTREN